jgi:hypothetical protein
MRYLIIGAGPAGLYAAGKILDDDPQARVTVVEKASYPGGRTRMIEYEGTLVPGGAGVVRETDVRLRALCARYGIPLTFTAKSPCYRGFTPRRDLLGLIDKFSRVPLTPEERSRTTFQEFLEQQLPDPTDRQVFMDTVGYTDYLNADVVDTLQDYGWRDVVGPPHGTRMSRIDWNHLIQCMAAPRKNLTITYGTEAIVIERDLTGGWWVTCSSTTVYRADRLVLAIPSVAIVRLLRHSHFPGCRTLAREIDDQVQMQPFLRLYASLPLTEKKGKSPPSQITCSPLQKSFPMSTTPDQQRRLWMLSYSDNAHALTVRNASTKRLAEWFFDSPHKASDLQDIQPVFYRHGTHYFKPLSLRYPSRDAFLDYIRNPMENLFITGEGFSHNQGWTEGALRVFTWADGPGWVSPKGSHRVPRIDTVVEA